MPKLKDIISKEVLNKMNSQFPKNRKMKTIQQFDVALIQLRGAIALFNQKDFICCITLVGAAEEIFSRMAYGNSYKKTGKGMNTTVFESELLEWQFGMKKEDYSIMRNKLKNALKHLTESRNIEYENFKDYAIDLIAAAITNYKLLCGKLPKEKIILDFCEKYGVS